jgi:hypothetical protein
VYLLYVFVVGLLIIPFILNSGSTHYESNQQQTNINVTLVVDKIYPINPLYSLVSAIVYRASLYPQGSLNPYLIYTLYNPYLTGPAQNLTIANYQPPGLGVSDFFMNNPTYLAIPQLPNLYIGDINYVTNTFFTGGYAVGIHGNPEQPYFITMVGLYNNISPSSNIFFGNNISFSYSCMQNLNYCNTNAGNTEFSFWSLLNSLFKIFFGGTETNAYQPPYTYPFILTTVVRYNVQTVNVGDQLYNLAFNSTSIETQYLFSSPYAQSGDPLAFNAALAIQRPIVSIWIPGANLAGYYIPMPLGVDNLGLYQLDQNSPLYRSINWQLTQQVLQSFGLNLTTYYNIPILFLPIMVNDSQLGLYVPIYEKTYCEAGAKPTDITIYGGPQCRSIVYQDKSNTMMGGFLSLLKYIPSSGYTYDWKEKSNVAFPYVIPLFTHISAQFVGQQIPGSISPLGLNATFYMPILVFGDGKVVLMGTALIGYNPYYNTPMVTFIQNGTITGYFSDIPSYSNTYYGFGGVAWVTGPGAGCNNITISAPVKPLSPYTHVYYLTASATMSPDSTLTKPYSISLFIWDPANLVGYLVNITNIEISARLNTQCMSLDSAKINVKTYDLSAIGGIKYEPYTYVDIEFAQNGYIVFYRDLYYDGQPNVVQIFVLDLNSGKIYTFTREIPILSYDIFSIPSVHGQMGSIMSVKSGYYLYQIKPELFYGSLSIGASLPINYTFSYSFAKVPVNIYYNGSVPANNVLIQINITDPKILSAISTPTAKDIRVFTSDQYGSDYYQYNGLTYAILSYKPGQLLSLLILMPTISPGNNTVYIYMGYPYARAVYVPANLLLSTYPLLKNG